jgi:hypothetical protein
MDRYRMMEMQQQQAAMMAQRSAAGAARKPILTAGMKTVWDENKLRFTLSVDSIRLKGK